MESFLNKYLSGDLSNIKGLKLEGSIPINDELLNDLLQEGISKINDRTNNQSNNLDSKYIDLLKYLNVKAESKEGKVVLFIKFLLK